MYSLTMKGLPSSSPVSRTLTTWGWSPSLRIACASRRARAWIAAADALGVEQRDGDLAVRGGVVGQVDALAPALAEEAPDPVAACADLGGDVGGKRLRRGPGSAVGFSRPRRSSAPQESQNRAPSRFSLPQDGHRMAQLLNQAAESDRMAGQGSVEPRSLTISSRFAAPRHR